MDRFYQGESPLHVTEIPSKCTTNAVGLCALWRLLLVPGSRCITIAANRDLESRFMGFLHEITTSIDPALTSVCRWTNRKALKIADTAGYELRFMSNRPEWAQGINDDTITFVILGAGSAEIRFSDTREALEGHLGRDGARFIYVW